MFFLVPWRIVTCMKRLPLSKCIGGHGPGKARWYEVNMNASWFDTVEGWLDEDPTGYRITIFRVAGQPDSEDAVVFDGGCLDVTKSMLEAFEAPNY